MEHWLAGYRQSELDSAQERYNLRFPPDLVELLLDRRPAHGFDWRTDDETIREALAWPLEGLFFDLEHAGLWHAEWGERPEALAWQRERVRELVATAPKLIPIMGHRYIPETPHEAGNPVFSVYQSDIIYYGANLTEYFEREFFPKWNSPPDYASIRRIEFWSFLVDNFAQGLNFSIEQLDFRDSD